VTRSGIGLRLAISGRDIRTVPVADGGAGA